jgi:phosphatidylglycerophosphatase C
MESISAAEVVRSLAGAPKAWVATDADGTLWEGDVGEDWLCAVEEGVARLDDAHVRAVAQAMGLGDLENPRDVVRLARNAFMLGSLEEATYFNLVALTLGKLPEPVARATVREALAGRALRERLIPETMTVLAGARSSDHRIVVVSASPRIVVEEAVALVGLDVDHVIGLELTDDAMHTRTPRPYGFGKALLLDGLRGESPVHAALGDSPFDAPMLARARTPLAVRPKSTLASLAPEVPGLRLLIA